MAKKPETLFKERVLAKLKELPVWFLKTQEVGRSGTPDLLICANGHFVAWELKVGEALGEPLQEYNLRLIKNAGGIGSVVTPANFEDALTTLRRLL